jgi:thiol-disulfide isomerase/thioredoxin
MKKYIVFVILLGLLIFIGCDRFEHKFEPVEENENLVIEFFSSFADSIATFPENISGIMNFYHDEYNNNGISKQDIENFYTAFTLINTPISLEAVLIDTTSTPEIQWRLLATELSGTTYMDTIFTDVILETATGDSYKFYGNQADLRNVVVELFTGQWCTNCPNAEEALHNLRIKYGSRFSYVEYHFGNDLLQTDESPIFYYPFMGGLPFGIVNGNEYLFYSAPSPEEVEEDIEQAIAPLLQEDKL